VVALLQQFLLRYGYLAVTLIVLVESMGIPLPGETILLLAGAYAGAGHLDIRGVILAGALGAIVGDTLGYAIGQRGGRAVLERYGHIVRLNEDHLVRAEDYFARHGDVTVFFGRFVAMLRVFSALLAGINRMPYRRFLAYNAAGGVLWAVVISLLGRTFGQEWPLVAHWVSRAGLVLLAILVLVVAVMWLRKR
jgi:membrane protein DedA with SNARE-associated domain